MKVGDLVELSAYGKKLLCLEAFKGDVGIVIRKHIFDDVSVRWLRLGKERYLQRRDIRKAKTK